MCRVSLQTYAHSLASLIDPVEFQNQVKEHADRIEMSFGQRPKVFRNTELIYSDEIASMVAAMGFQGMITEGAKHILAKIGRARIICIVRLRLLT